MAEAKKFLLRKIARALKSCWYVCSNEHSTKSILRGDGYEALDLMRNGVFDAVITDWDMPRLNRSEFLALSLIFWPETPVIVISAHAVPSPGELPQGAFA